VVGQGIARSVESHKRQLNLSLVLPKVREVTPSLTPEALARGPLPSKDRFSSARHFEIVDIAVAPPIPHDPTRNAMVPGSRVSTIAFVARFF
jgi:hypothetical protein